MARIFVTGIGTGIGKTVTSAILCEALGADYWKPVQAGSLEATDRALVSSLTTNSRTHVYPERYLLREPMSPHAAAAREGILMQRDDFVAPSESKDLVIEGAGGVMVPLASNFLMLDLISHLQAEVVLVSKNYLGSINHTLLSFETLSRRRIPILGIVFNGPRAPESEAYIKEYTELRVLGHIGEETQITKEVVSQYAQKFKQTMAFVLRRSFEK